MDKRVTLAVAGSGKTRTIIDELDSSSRALIITYTNNNYENLRQRVQDKFGKVPDNISIYTYFSFLYTFCYLPCMYSSVRSRSINYNEEHKSFARKGVGADNFLYYQDYAGNLLGNRLALLMTNFALDDAIKRIERFYDYFVIDEIQDLAANDFNFVVQLTNANVRVLYVGDFYQHTYDTSRDGHTQTNLHKKGYDYYKGSFGTDIRIDDSSLLKSFRCSASVCKYVRDNLGIAIESQNDRMTKIEIVEDEAKIKEIMDNDDIPKLFYKSHSKYNCASANWGASKGIDKFDDVCVIGNATVWPMIKTNNFKKIVDSTKNKLYVAITRTRGNLYFISEEAISDYKN